MVDTIVSGTFDKLWKLRDTLGSFVIYSEYFIHHHTVLVGSTYEAVVSNQFFKLSLSRSRVFSMYSTRKIHTRGQSATLKHPLEGHKSFPLEGVKNYGTRSSGKYFV